MRYSVWARAPLAIVTALAVVALLFTSGCGKDQTAEAPPQSLSEPIRPTESAPAQSPLIPKADEEPMYASTRTDSKPLPTFISPDPVPAEAPAAIVPVEPTQSGGGQYHVLQKGETLYAVARKYGVKAKDIINANNFKDPNKLTVGTKVYVPVK